MNFNSKSVTIIVIINVIIFLSLDIFGVVFSEIFALYFPENEKFNFWQPVTHLFLHGSFAHLVFNMFALFSFGSILESRWGTKKFLHFYFVSGLGAALVYTLVNYFQYTPIYNQLLNLGLTRIDIQNLLSTGSVNSDVLRVIPETKLQEFYSIFHTPAVGASGAIYGILIAYAITFPNAKLALIFLPVPVSAKYFVPVLITADLFFGMTKYSIGNIAHFAHIGGAIFGLLMMLWWRRAKY